MAISVEKKPKRNRSELSETKWPTNGTHPQISALVSRPSPPQIAKDIRGDQGHETASLFGGG